VCTQLGREYTCVQKITEPTLKEMRILVFARRAIAHR
jgi:hypothetical protein